MNSNSYPALIGAAFAVLAVFAALMGAGLAALTTFAAAGARKRCKNVLAPMRKSWKEEAMRVVKDLPISVGYGTEQTTKNAPHITSSPAMIAVRTAFDEPLTTARQSVGHQLTNALRRCWSAYEAWRVEQAAINELASLSDRELKDIGLHRCSIVCAVRDRAWSERTFSFRTEDQSVVADWRGDAVVGAVTAPIYQPYSNPRVPNTRQISSR
jgi:uncharacterized protein YjiS (DUF1127 family)